MTAGTAERAQPVRVPAAAPRRRLRLALRRTATGLVATATAAALGLGIGWQLTPAVDDAPARVAASLAAAGSPALSVEPAAALVQALIATEDSSFYANPGVSPTGSLRAFQGLLTGTDQGGSTLSQQLAKNVYLDGENGPLQKAEAVVLAIKLDATYSKAEILRMYLDDGYYGHGFTGLTAATEGYFGVQPDELTWAQATLLAGLFQAPSAYDPLLHPDLAAARQAHVLDRLVDEGVLSRAEADTVATDDWGLVAG